MVTVIVFHFTEKGLLPTKLSEEAYRSLRTEIDKVLEDPKYKDVYFNGTFVDENGKGVCLWNAPNAEIVKEVIEEVLGCPPVDGAIEVKQVI